MGNHEFCEECGASSFHYGHPCDPKRKAKYQAERKKIERREKAAEQAVKIAIKTLKTMGYKTEINEYGDVVIDRFSLLTHTMERPVTIHHCTKKKPYRGEKIKAGHMWVHDNAKIVGGLYEWIECPNCKETFSLPD